VLGGIAGSCRGSRHLGYLGQIGHLPEMSTLAKPNSGQDRTPPIGVSYVPWSARKCGPSINRLLLDQS